jgi:hypothetical protein
MNNKDMRRKFDVTMSHPLTIMSPNDDVNISINILQLKTPQHEQLRI